MSEGTEAVSSLLVGGVGFGLVALGSYDLALPHNLWLAAAEYILGFTCLRLARWL